jgi:hypothetical protein
MLTNIQQMETNIEKMRKDIAMDRWKVLLQFITTLAVGIATGVGLATYAEHHGATAPVQQSQGKS